MPSTNVRFLAAALLCAIGATCVAEHADADELGYRFVRGDAFAYEMKIEWAEAGRSYWLAGTPLVLVTRGEKTKSQLLIVGRLHQYKQSHEGTAERLPNRDYWFGPLLTTDQRADRVNADQGQGGKLCPVSPAALVTRLLFPRLPAHDSARLKSGETSELVTLRFGGVQLTPGKRRRGRREAATQATPLGDSIVQLDISSKYVTKDRSLQTYYRAQAVFDKSKGRITAVSARHAKQDGAVAHDIRLQVAEITDPTAFAAVESIAEQDFEDLPADMKPLLLARQRLDLWLPEHYHYQALPPAGTLVGHLDKKEHEYFAAQYVGPVSGRNRVKIRYVGSNEELEVSGSALAILGSSRVRSGSTRRGR